MKKQRILTIIIMSAMLGLIAIMIISLFPLFKEVIANTSDETVMVKYIRSYGLKGIPILIGMQALQVIVAFIPSAAIQLLTGLCYGVWLGTLINLIGSILGNLLVFSSLRQLKSVLAPFFDRQNTHKRFLNPQKLSRAKHPVRIAFFFFLIPGIPNGIVPYVFAQTNISLAKYLIAVTAGSIPSTFLCTFLGDRLSHGKYSTAVVVAVAVVLIITVALLFKNKIMMKITR